MWGLLEKLLKNLLLEINVYLKAISSTFKALLPILLILWFVLWILNVEDLRGLEKYIRWWILLCLVIIGISQGLSLLITARIR